MLGQDHSRSPGSGDAGCLALRRERQNELALCEPEFPSHSRCSS
jgi:hypothetical protein